MGKQKAAKEIEATREKPAVAATTKPWLALPRLVAPRLERVILCNFLYADFALDHSS